MATNPDLIVTPASATSSATNGLVSHVTKGDTGIGEANNASTWDEFPNGRFGDINSPAFGSQDLWGGFGRIVSCYGFRLFSACLRVDDRHPVAHVLVRSMTSRP
jgi:hypothetical protein